MTRLPETVNVDCKACGATDIPLPFGEYRLELDPFGRARHAFECPLCGDCRWDDWRRGVDATAAIEEILVVAPGLRPRLRRVGSVKVCLTHCIADWERAVAVQEPRLVRGSTVLWDSLDLAIWRELDALEGAQQRREASA